jgi:hypothetical protein
MKGYFCYLHTQLHCCKVFDGTHLRLGETAKGKYTRNSVYQSPYSFVDYQTTLAVPTLYKLVTVGSQTNNQVDRICEGAVMTLSRDCRAFAWTEGGNPQKSPAFIAHI